MVAKRTTKPSSKAKKAEKLSEQPVTSETLADHRQQVLKHARKYVKPLGVSRKKFFILTISLIVAAIVIITAVFGLLIYRFKSDSQLVYRVARIIPYPAAKVNGHFISYGDYLFELNPLKHYYQNPAGPAGGSQQPVDFKSPEGKEQLHKLQQVALDEAKQKVAVQQLADEKQVKVSQQELDEAVKEAVAREGGDKKFNEAISYFYGWSIADFRRVMRFQLLQRKLQPQFSEAQRKQAEELQARAKGGEDFSNLAKTYSEDPGSKEKGGDLGLTSRGAYVKEFEEAAFGLPAGEVSNVVETQFGFHIIKIIEKKDDQVHVAHILIKFADISQIIKDKLAQGQATTYIRLEPVAEPDNADPAPQQAPQPAP